ncbi:MAG: class I SAM-dependent methyltransferase [Acidimicrobiales bacterium]
MDAAEAGLRGYYEEEALRRLRTPPTGRRVATRQRFVSLLGDEGRRSVVDFGSGPGDDGSAFVAAGLRFVGLDLAHGNGVVAAARGVHVVQGSVTAPPFPARSFDAGWSMSVLMHLRDEEVPGAVAAMTDVLRPGAPLVVGLWGGDTGHTVGNRELGGHRRTFWLRPLEVNLRLIATGGRVEHADRWDLGDDEEEYQLFQLRVDP